MVQSGLVIDTLFEGGRRTVRWLGAADAGSTGPLSTTSEYCVLLDAAAEEARLWLGAEHPWAVRILGMRAGHARCVRNSMVAHHTRG